MMADLDRALRSFPIRFEKWEIRELEQVGNMIFLVRICSLGKDGKWGVGTINGDGVAKLKRVRTKSRGYVTVTDVTPANPPATSL